MLRTTAQPRVQLNTPCQWYIEEDVHVAAPFKAHPRFLGTTILAVYLLSFQTLGSKDPNNRVLRPKYYNINGIWALKPFYLVFGPIVEGRGRKGMPRKEVSTSPRRKGTLFKAERSYKPLQAFACFSYWGVSRKYGNIIPMYSLPCKPPVSPRFSFGISLILSGVLSLMSWKSKSSVAAQ